MTKTKKIQGTAEAWESGKLGCDEKYASLSEELTTDMFNELSESKSISIRLKESMIDDLKFFADLEDLGYQTLIKNLLQRFINCEYKKLARDLASEKAKDKAELAAEAELEYKKTA